MRVQTPRTDREMAIEQVVSIIMECPEYYQSAEDVEDINAGDGWSFEVRWPSHEYIGDDNYTRVEGMSLSDADLAEVIARVAL